MKSLLCGITDYRPTDKQTKTGVEEVRNESAPRRTPSKPLWRTKPDQTRGTEHSTLIEK